jgi:hypothetical protein
VQTRKRKNEISLLPFFSSRARVIVARMQSTRHFFVRARRLPLVVFRDCRARFLLVTSSSSTVEVFLHAMRKSSSSNNHVHPSRRGQVPSAPPVPASLPLPPPPAIPTAAAAAAAAAVAVASAPVEPVTAAWTGRYRVAEVDAPPFKINDNNQLLDCDPVDPVATVLPGEGVSKHALSLTMDKLLYALRAGDTFRVSLFIRPTRVREESEMLRKAIPHQYGNWGEPIDVRRLEVGAASVGVFHMILSFGGLKLNLEVPDTPACAVFAEYPRNIYLAMDIDDPHLKLRRLQKMR